MTTNTGVSVINDKVKKESGVIDAIRFETSKVVVGQSVLIDRLLIGILANGHVLVEGVPGLAKTTAVKTLAQTIQAKFQRLQFTPDMLPADLTGTLIYDQRTGTFNVKKGPIFANIILADEINRAPAKVQSALLEAMQERQVTIGNNSYSLEEPFLVLATQNPIEQEGTYPLPEAQVDRFMLKVVIDYPSKTEEQAIIRQNVLGMEQPRINAVVSSSEVINARQLVREVYMDEKVEQYIIDIVFASRYPEKYNLAKMKPLISYGGSPRASINLALASKAYAYLNKRGYVIPEDVRNICKDVLRHRIGLTYEAEAENVNVEMVINEILKAVNVP